jgi:membrane fusion protein
MNGLFRREVLEAKRGSWLGSISLAQPLRLWVLAVLAAIFAAIVLSFFIFGEYTRRSRVEGELVPDLGLSTVVAPSAGVVATLHAEEGDRVQRQAALLLINVPRVTAAGDDALKVMREGQEARAVSLGMLQDAQDRQLQVQQRGIEQQREALRRELKQIEGEIHTRGEQVRIGRETVQRFRQVVDQRYVSLIQLGQQEQSMLDMLNAQQSLRRQATSMRRTLAQLDQSLAEVPEQRRAARASTERDLATLSQESVQAEANGELLLRAPVSGLVASRLVEAGQAVQIGQPILSLLPEGSQLRAQLLVPSAAIGFVKPGDRVLLRTRNLEATKARSFVFLEVQLQLPTPRVKPESQSTGCLFPWISKVFWRMGCRKHCAQGCVWKRTSWESVDDCTSGSSSHSTPWQEKLAVKLFAFGAGSISRRLSGYQHFSSDRAYRSNECMRVMTHRFLLRSCG